ncbi:MAG: hypothetical protein IK015_06990, partial [Treponema sp.]|nr:hypothetical protein [Treponema sp.]
KEKMEKELKSKDKEFQRLSEQDFADLNRLGSEKMELKDFLFQISEPKYFVIAPMSYSTEKFEDDNWSAKKKNQPSIRVALLETAINKFENYIDDMLGVSFLDRSKIAQIEKEH